MNHSRNSRIVRMCRDFVRKISCSRSHHSAAFSVDIPDVTLSQYVQRDFGQYLRKTALIDGTTGRCITFEDLHERTDRCTAGLMSAGVLPGDVVCLYGLNAPEFAEILMSVNNNGAALTVANSQSTAVELASQLILTDTKLVICTPDCASRALSAIQNTQSKNIRVYVIGKHVDGCFAYTDLLEDGRTLPNIRVHSSDTALLPFSSGTTGLPKGVVLSHRNLVSNLSQIRHPSVLPFPDRDDVVITALPMVHIAGLVIGLLNPLAQGATVVTLPRFDLHSYLTAFEQYQGTFSLVAPPIVNLLAKDPTVDKYNLSSIRCLYSGASTLSKELAVQMVDRLQMPNLRQGYGMSETSPVITTDPVGKYKYGSIGKPVPNTQIKLVCPEQLCDITAPHQIGELWAKGPQVTNGYLKNELATSEAFTEDGWLKTGDMGYYDDDGHYYIVDRIKDIIKYKGYQISPAYLESVLLSHPAVADVAVIGVPAGVMGEVPRAYVTLKHKISTKGLKQFVSERVAPYKHLRGGIEIADTIPKSPSGKILRRVLQNNFKNSKSEINTAKE